MTAMSGSAAGSADDGGLPVPFDGSVRLPDLLGGLDLDSGFDWDDSPDQDTDSAVQPMDRADLRILADLQAIFDAVDPMPEMLPELVLFGLDAHDLEAEFARLVESELAVAGGRLHAELRVGETILTAECDESGRFVFDAVPAGPARLVLHPTLDSDPSLTLPVVTPAVHL